MVTGKLRLAKQTLSTSRTFLLESYLEKPPCDYLDTSQASNLGPTTLKKSAYNSHSNGYEGISHCGFDLHFPNN